MSAAKGKDFFGKDVRTAGRTQFWKDEGSVYTRIINLEEDKSTHQSGEVYETISKRF